MIEKQLEKQRQRLNEDDYRTEPLVAVRSADAETVARALTEQTARYLDCRSEMELAAGVIAGSVNIPFPHNGNSEPVEPEDFLVDVGLEFERHETIYVGCKSGKRSALAVEILNGAGYARAVNVTGGILAWRDAGLPITPFAG